MPVEPQDAYIQSTLHAAPRDTRSRLERRCGALTVAARVMAVPAMLLAAVAAGLALWQVGRAAGLAEAAMPVGQLSPPERLDSPLTMAAVGLISTAILICAGGALWVAGGWFRMMGERPLPRAEAAAQLARVGRLTRGAGVGLLVYTIVGWAWALGANGAMTFDLTPLAGAAAALLLAAGMGLAAEAIDEGPSAN